MTRCRGYGRGCDVRSTASGTHCVSCSQVWDVNDPAAATCPVTRWQGGRLAHPFKAALVIGQRPTDGKWVAWEAGSKVLHGPFFTCAAAAEAGAKSLEVNR